MIWYMKIKFKKLRMTGYSMASDHVEESVEAIVEENV
jgi:hypothetical protein